MLWLEARVTQLQRSLELFMEVPEFSRTESEPERSHS